MREIERCTEKSLSFFGSRLVRLVDDDNVADLQQAGLDGLNSVAEPRGLDDDYCVGK
jgi:hypothetical protein